MPSVNLNIPVSGSFQTSQHPRWDFLNEKPDSRSVLGSLKIWTKLPFTTPPVALIAIEKVSRVNG